MVEIQFSGGDFACLVANSSHVSFMLVYYVYTAL